MRRLIEQHPLKRGSHPSRDDGMCAMEMVSWLAGEAHSDEPECACPVLTAYVRACNDAMSNTERQRHLRPLVPQLVNSRRSVSVERVRGLAAIDALVRQLLPAALEQRGRVEDARRLRALPAVRDLSMVRAARTVLKQLPDDHRVARWVLDRAAEGTPAPRYVAGLVEFVRRAHRSPDWAQMAELARALVTAAPAPCGEPAENAS